MSIPISIETKQSDVCFQESIFESLLSGTNQERLV
jgi:hypothetical protein